MDNLVNRVLANVLPDLVRMGERALCLQGHTGDPVGWKGPGWLGPLSGKMGDPQLWTPSWGAFFLSESLKPVSHLKDGN